MIQSLSQRYFLLQVDCHIAEHENNIAMIIVAIYMYMYILVYRFK